MEYILFAKRIFFYKKDANNVPDNNSFLRNNLKHSYQVLIDAGLMDAEDWLRTKKGM